MEMPSPSCASRLARFRTIRVSWEKNTRERSESWTNGKRPREQNEPQTTKAVSLERATVFMGNRVLLYLAGRDVRQSAASDAPGSKPRLGLSTLLDRRLPDLLGLVRHETRI